jgi:hypothetical protein
VELEHLLERVESAEFAAQLGVASTLGTFIRGLLLQAEVRELRAAISGHPAHQQLLLARVDSLAGRETDVRYENPWDIALATYVWVLMETDQVLGRLAGAAISEGRNLWWARYIVDLLLQPRSTADTTHLSMRAHHLMCSANLRATDTWDSIVDPRLRLSLAYIQRVINEASIAGPSTRCLLVRSRDWQVRTDAGRHTRQVDERVAA